MSGGGGGATLPVSGGSCASGVLDFIISELIATICSTEVYEPSPSPKTFCWMTCAASFMTKKMNIDQTSAVQKPV